MLFVCLVFLMTQETSFFLKLYSGLSVRILIWQEYEWMIMVYDKFDVVDKLFMMNDDDDIHSICRLMTDVLDRTRCVLTVSQIYVTISCMSNLPLQNCLFYFFLHHPLL